MSKTDKASDLVGLIQNERANGNIVIITPCGLRVGKLSKVIKQPTDGLLYDLNRDEATILTFIDDTKWVNDYACAMVIRALKDRIEELEKLIV